MEYTTVLTHQPGEAWQAFVPFLPNFLVEADSRDEVLDKVVAKLQEVAMHVEVLQLEIPDAQHSIVLNGHTKKKGDDIPWELFGYFKDNPLSDRLFEEAERERDNHWIGGPEDGEE